MISASGALSTMYARASRSGSWTSRPHEGGARAREAREGGKSPDGHRVGPEQAEVVSQPESVPRGSLPRNTQADRRQPGRTEPGGTFRPALAVYELLSNPL